MDRETIGLVGFAGLFVLIALRVPIGVAMSVVSLAGFAAIVGLDPALQTLPLATLNALANWEFGLIPLFILMGAVASEAGMSRALYRAANFWIGHLRGGLAMATIVSATGFAAICGSSVATAATMTRIALPELERNRYPQVLSLGSIAAGGTLGILIPPSVPLAIYGIITQTDIGLLFMAGLLPGLLAAALYLLTIYLWRRVGGLELKARRPAGARARCKSLLLVLPTLGLFAVVMGGIYAGVFTATEAAGVGAAAAIVIGVVQRKLPRAALLRALRETVATSSSLFLVLIGALLYGRFLAVTRLPQMLNGTVEGFGLSPLATILVLLGVFVLLGCVLDAMAILLLMVPLVMPLVGAYGFDPVWFGIVTVMVIELGLITPPIGMNIFVIRSVRPEAPLGAIYRGVMPFVAMDVLRVLLVVFIPAIALILPRAMGY
ncbi:TRAP transporter large permease [Pseudodonghicola flavimaris]|uniref:TRAP transporter large permease protein n=1 Tax=Pseudodonghicola flavimaris TaxID=3050036 RepID=A0ABT7F207_9RHOB|nr:TRAP transporter large permease [Pseudodonghicola flavimaris]MDK3018640.1 TRAP transporter large permease [Pseudodonghicola flavimaris]